MSSGAPLDGALPRRPRSHYNSRMDTRDAPPPLPEGLLDRIDAIVGPRGWSMDAAECLAHAADFLHAARGRTPLVLKPATTEEVAALVKVLREHRVPVVPQGGNTGLVGGGVPDDSGRQVVLSLQRMARILEVDAEGEVLVCEAGAVLADVQRAAMDAGRLFPLSLGAEGSARIGGLLSTNAGGVNVLRYGMAREMVLGIEAVLPDGRVWNGLRRLRKDNTGYDLKQVFIGAEGTLGIVTKAALRLYPLPRERQTVWLAVESPAAAVTLFARFRDAFGETVTSFELITGLGVALAERRLGLRPPIDSAHPWHVLAEVAWTFEEGLAARLEGLLEAVIAAGLVLDGAVAQSEAQREAFWAVRESQSEAMAKEGAVVRNDVTVPVRLIPELVARVRRVLEPMVPGVRVMPFGHVGDGNLHMNLMQPEAMSREAFVAVRADIQTRLYDIVQDLDGSISAEHGIGRLKRDELARRKDPVELELMRTLKRALDPEGLMNPGVIV
jgi:FAD/FMN-containing dehydrogenase